MTAGRPRNFPPCPLCQQPIKASHSYRCGCRGYIVREGKLCPTRARIVKEKPQQVKAEVAVKFLTASEFERLQDPAPRRKVRKKWLTIT